jgi:polyphosphate kinase
VFVHLASQSRLPRLRKLWLAPFYLHRRLTEKIDAWPGGGPGQAVAAASCQDERADRRSADPGS